MENQEKPIEPYFMVTNKFLKSNLDLFEYDKWIKHQMAFKLAEMIIEKYSENFEINDNGLHTVLPDYITYKLGLLVYPTTKI